MLGINSAGPVILKSHIPDPTFLVRPTSRWPNRDTHRDFFQLDIAELLRIQDLRWAGCHLRITSRYGNGNGPDETGA